MAAASRHRAWRKLILTALVAGAMPAVASPGLLPQQGAASQPADPPWGSLNRTPIFLEASLRLVEAIPLPSPRPRWSFPAQDAARIPELLVQAGVPAELAKALTGPDRTVVADGWIHLFPTSEEILALDPGVRPSLYSLLGQLEINEFYHSPVLILSETVEEWYRSAELRPELVNLISRLACRRGKLWAFSEIPLVLAQAQGEGEARQLFKAFTRTRSYLVTLNIGPDTDAGRLNNYWTAGGRAWRRKDIEPLIESIRDSGKAVRLDLCHLLPPLARKLLFTYPGEEHAAKGIMPDCHWTSLNFFNYDPHDYLLDPRLATSNVLEDFKPVPPPYDFGDILFFLDEKEGNAFHSCIYLAEDLVFTKNGRNQIVPWIISTLDDVSRVYLSMTPGRIQAYRQRATAAP